MAPDFATVAERCRLSATACSTSSRTPRVNTVGPANVNRAPLRRVQRGGRSSAPMEHGAGTMRGSLRCQSNVSRDALQQIASSSGAAPWAFGGSGIGGIHSVVNHVNQVTDRVLWGMVARQMNVEEEFIEGRLAQLEALMPGCRLYLSQNKVPVLSALIKLDGSTVAMGLMDLRSSLPPGTDVARIAASRPELLLSGDSRQATKKAVEALCKLLPSMGKNGNKTITELLSAEPGFLETEQVEIALSELARLKPDSDAEAMLLADVRLLRMAQPPPKRRDPNDEYYI